MESAGAQRIVDTLHILGSPENSEQSKHDAAAQAGFLKILGIWSKDYQRMRNRVQRGISEAAPYMSYTLKVMLFCLALTMCIIGVSQQIGLSLIN